MKYVKPQARAQDPTDNLKDYKTYLAAQADSLAVPDKAKG